MKSSTQKPSKGKKSPGSSSQQFNGTDNREQAAAQRQEQELINNSPRTIAQRQAFDEALGTSGKIPNNTGMPDTLKEGVENLSGISLDDVKVHYNSSKPEQLQALAYAQGNNIHLAPGQEKHLPHEAWHIIQQKQGRVQPVTEVNGVPVNDSAHLESEADAMGRKAMTGGTASETPVQKVDADVNVNTVQRKVGFELEEGTWQVFVKADLPEKGGKNKDDSRNIYEELNGKKRKENESLILNKARILEKHGFKPPGKKIILYPGKYFKLETDGPYNEYNFMDLEFVTKAFDENEEGLEELKKALAKISEIMEMLCTHSGMKLEKGEFIGPEIHGFKDVYLSGGGSVPGFKMQATQGLELKDVSALMEYFGSDVPNETKKQTTEREQARILMRKDGKSDKTSAMIGQSPTIARKIVQELLDDNVIDDTDDLPSLTGFFSMMTLYILSLKKITPQGIKVSLPFMSRLPFNNLFSMIKKGTRKKLADRIYRVEVDLEEHISPYYENFDTLNPLINNIPLSINFTNFKPIFDNLQKLDVQDWLHGIILHDTDHLTKNGIVQYLDSWGTQYEEFEKTYKIFVRGHGSSENLEQDDTPLAVIENRSISPFGSGQLGRDMDMIEASQAAISYLTFMAQIKNAGGDHSAIGAFPELTTFEAQKKKQEKTTGAQPTTSNINNNNSSSSSSGKKDDKCFLTTACMMTMNLPDDCFELVTLRKFRDEYILHTEEGRQLIDEYYTIAPVIVSSIQQDTEEEKLWKMIYKIIHNCIKHIQKNNPQNALNMYINMVKGLRKRYEV